MLIPFVVGAVEYKLFVGSLNKQATEKEVEEVGHLHYLFRLRLLFFPQRCYSWNIYFSFPFEISCKFCLNVKTFLRYVPRLNEL